MKISTSAAGRGAWGVSPQITFREQVGRDEEVPGASWRMLAALDNAASDTRDVFD